MRRKFGKRILAGLLASAMAFGMCPLSTVRAATELTREDFEELVSAYAVSKDAQGYEDYIAQLPQQRPDAVITVDAADFVRYEEGNEAAQPQILGNFLGQLNVKSYDGILSINKGMELVRRIVGRGSQDNLS